MLHKTEFTCHAQHQDVLTLQGRSGAAGRTHHKVPSMSNTTPLRTGRSEEDVLRLSLRGAKRFAVEEAIVAKNRQFIGKAGGRRTAGYECLV